MSAPSQATLLRGARLVIEQQNAEIKRLKVREAFLVDAIIAAVAAIGGPR